MLVLIAVAVYVFSDTVQGNMDVGMSQSEFTRLCGDWYNNHQCSDSFYDGDLKMLCEDMYGGGLEGAKEKCKRVCENACNPVGA